METNLSTASRQTYVVHIRFESPAWDEREGIDYEVEAVSKSAAIKSVRRTAYNDGHTVGRRAYFSAKAKEEDLS